jgi:predicted RNase H-like HicB family nuclease
MMRVFTGTVSREGKWWVAVLDGDGPATQGCSLDELYEMVIDLVSVHCEIEPGEFEVRLSLPVRLDWVRPGWWSRLRLWPRRR